MNLSVLKRVTIISEALSEERLLADLKRLGARGYTLTEVRGEGSRGVRASEWEGNNIKIETLVSATIATAILEFLAERYFPSYAVVAHQEEVDVVRGEKYI